MNLSGSWAELLLSICGAIVFSEGTGHVQAIMQLRRLEYFELPSAGPGWELRGAVFGRFNLVVGRNATGKTRMLNAISRLAGVLSGECPAPKSSVQWDLEMARGAGGEPARFVVQCAARQTRGGEELQEWADRLQYWPFGQQINLRIAGGGAPKHLPAAEVFQEGLARFGPGFHDAVAGPLAEAGTGLQRIEPRVGKAGEPGAAWLAVKERPRAALIPARRLSQGQQRTLALVILLRFLESAGQPVTVLLDDFAEGLDFEMSRRLTEWLLSRAEASPVQIIAATNERAVMNRVPLEHWSILAEDGAATRVVNIENSPKLFEDFKFTGLSHFDFFSMDFAHGGGGAGE